jgi:hypothetical protein
LGESIGAKYVADATIDSICSNSIALTGQLRKIARVERYYWSRQLRFQDAANAAQPWRLYKVRDVRLNNVRINDRTSDTALCTPPLRA